jgi:hypothetical protein
MTGRAWNKVAHGTPTGTQPGQRPPRRLSAAAALVRGVRSRPDVVLATGVAALVAAVCLTLYAWHYQPAPAPARPPVPAAERPATLTPDLPATTPTPRPAAPERTSEPAPSQLQGSPTAGSKPSRTATPEPDPVPEPAPTLRAPAAPVPEPEPAPEPETPPTGIPTTEEPTP